MSFVELDRRFFPWTEDRSPADPFLLASLSGSLNWSQILGLPRVVVLAEAGNGKSDEMINQAAALQNAGRFAFYATVQDVAHAGIPVALRMEDKVRFTQWKVSSEPAWFLVDSIDEAKLDGIRLETALRQLAEAIEGHAARANIVLSGRITDWEFRTDLARFTEFLPIPQGHSSEPPEAPQEALVRVLNQERRRESKEGAKKPSVVLMTQLDSARVRLFAAAKGVERDDDFIAAIDAANLWSMAARPVDLIWLVDYWQVNRRFGSYAQMLETSVAERLREVNPQHGRRDELAINKSLAALERVGAALDFGRVDEIAVPDSSIAFRESTAKQFDLGAILPDWGQGARQKLLGRPVFDAGTYGRVRLHNDHQGVIRSYLAARWLRQRLSANCPKSAVAELLFAETYGLRLVRPSMHQTAAWLSIWDADVAREVMDRDPRLLLSGGDPSSLSLSTREEALSRVVEVLVTTGDRIRQYPREELRRIAQPDMAAVTRRLWDQHKQNDEVRQLLLLIIELGELTQCADIAREGVWGRFGDKHTKIFAGRALLASGDASLMDRYAQLLKSDVTALPGVMIYDALEKLFPGRVSVDELLPLFRALSPAQRDDSYGMQITGPKLLARIDQRLELEQLLAGMLDLMGDRPPAPNYEETAAERAYEPGIKQACERLLLMLSPEDAPQVVIDAILRLGADRRYRRDESFNELTKLLHISPQRRRLVLWRAAEKFSGHPIIQKRPISNLLQIDVLGWPPGLVKEDLGWLLEDFPTRPSEAMQSLAVDAAMRIWQDNGKSPADLTRIRAAVSSNPNAESCVESWLSPPPRSEEMERLLQENERLVQEQTQRLAQRNQSWIEFIERMKADPKQLLSLPAPTSDSVDSRLFHLWQLVSSETANKNQYAIDDISFLEPILGVELIAAMEAALITFWRQRKPTLESERPVGKRNVINSVDCMGLVGISLQAKNDPSWPIRLTPEEAIIAAQYATIELNGFPAWFGALAQAWPRQVEEVLLREVRSQLADAGPVHQHGILDDLVQATTDIAAVMAPRLVEELRARPGLIGWQLSLLLDNITRSVVDDLSKAGLKRLALDRFESSANEEEQALYLGAAFRSGPVEATEALTAMLNRLDATAQARLGQLLLPRIFGNHGLSRGQEAPELPFDVLERLVHVAYHTIRPTEDNNHSSGIAHAIDSRDFAESARSAAFNQLYNTPGYKTFIALGKMASMPAFPIDRAHLRNLALSRALQDSERAPWPPREAYELEQKFDLAPQTPADLKSLVMSRIAEIQHDLHHADFSQGATVKSLPDEREVQKWVASELKYRQGRAYSLEREPHVVDEKEPDVRLLSAATGARLPVEVKVAESWSLRQLEEALSQQLCGKYMRERGDTHGILLLVHQVPRSRGWKVNAGKYLNFAQLVSHLKAMSLKIAGAAHTGPQPTIAVIDISDVKRPNGGIAKRKTKAKTKTKSKKGAKARSRKGASRK